MNRPPFIPFDERRAVRIYQRRLPHWRQDGATYFVTFRLGDSIPGHVTRAWVDERGRWLAARAPGFDPSVDEISTGLAQLSPDYQFRYHKHFNRLMQEYLDRGIGECLLCKPNCVAIVRNQILSDDGRSYHVGDFIIMPNHVHLLLVPASGGNLEDILRCIKGASSRNCNVELRRTGRLWQPESYDHIVRSLEQLLAYCDYIAANPQKAGITVPSEATYRAEWMRQWLKTD